jgi:hypothetical protein
MTMTMAICFYTFYLEIANSDCIFLQMNRGHIECTVFVLVNLYRGKECFNGFNGSDMVRMMMGNKEMTDLTIRFLQKNIQFFKKFLIEWRWRACIDHNFTFSMAYDVAVCASKT